MKHKVNSETTAEQPARRSLKELLDCRRCTRLEACRETIAKPAKGFAPGDYWAKPVPGFGDPDPRLLILGLAPGFHGANRTGRPFTGDAAGTWLYPTLHKFGFSNQPGSTRLDDGLELRGACITNVVKCVPPGNRPLPVEIANCAPFLAEELHRMKRIKVVIGLGNVAQQSYLLWAQQKGLIERRSQVACGHAKELVLPNGHHLLMSYHPSRQNTNTGRLTMPMFEAVFARARQLLT